MEFVGLITLLQHLFDRKQCSIYYFYDAVYISRWNTL